MNTTLNKHPMRICLHLGPGSFSSGYKQWIVGVQSIVSTNVVTVRGITRAGITSEMTQALLDLVLMDTPWLLDINNLATISETPPKKKIEIKCEETYQPLSPPTTHIL